MKNKVIQKNQKGVTLVALVITIIVIIIIISFIVPVKREIEGYRYGEGEFDISIPENSDYTIYAHKNIYGITIKREYRLGIEIIN